MSAVMLPLPRSELDEYSALMVRAEDLDNEATRLERQLKAVRLRKIEITLRIDAILARRPKL